MWAYNRMTGRCVASHAHTIGAPMRTTAAIVLAVAVLPSAGNADDCYGLAAPTFADHLQESERAKLGFAPKDLDGAHARDCQTVKALIDCGMQQRDAVAIVVDRHAKEGYMADLIAKCSAATAKAPGGPPARR